MKPTLEDLERLSQLLDGELALADAQALRARIAAEPELAEAWTLLRGLPGELGALPLELPPAALDEAVVAAGRPVVPVAPPVAAVRPLRDGGGDRPRIAPGPSSASRWRGLGAAAAVGAALAAAVLLFPRQVPRVVVQSGEQLVVGRAEVLAGDRWLQVDGEVEITVEPDVRSARGMGAEGSMDRSHGVAAGLGALVTVTVLQGSALLLGDDGRSEALREGDTRRWGGEPRAERRVVSAGGAAPSAPVASADPAGELERLRLENALLRGQLQGHVGVAQPWPASLPALYGPEGFEGRARQMVAGVQGMELVRADCDEYPCIAFYRLADPTQPLDDVLREPLTQTYGDDANVMVWGVRSVDDDGHSFALAAVAVTPDENGADVATIRTRVNARVEPTVEELSGDEEGQAP